jgi:tetratricopeptide (TPR) repeat protein
VKNLFPSKLIEMIQPHVWTLLPLFSMTIAVYAGIFGHEFQVNWDDTFYVIDNNAVHGFSWDNFLTVFSTCYVGNYAPVQMLSYMLDYEIWGFWAGGYLLTNVVIHCLNGLLIYRLLLKLHKVRFIATIATALFLLHPVQVESVAWVSQRKNLLAMLFFLLAWEFYIRFKENINNRRVTTYILSLTMFGLALMSKSVVVIFPIVLILYDICFSTVHCRIRVLDKIPFVLAAVAVTFFSLKSQSIYEGGGRLLEYHGGSGLTTLYSMLPIFCDYVVMLVWPMKLSAEYSPTIHSSLNPTVFIAAFLAGLMLYLGTRLFCKNRRAGFWVIFFILGLLPVAQIIPLNTLMNDRYLYFPIIGAAALFALGVAKVRDNLSARSTLSLYAFLALFFVFFSAISFRQVAVWKNAVSLWSNAVAKNPGSTMAWQRLGEAFHFSRPAQTEQALRAYGRAIELNRANDDALYNMGSLYTASGRYELGHAALIRLLEHDPEHVMGWGALGENLRKSGALAEAEMAYLQAYKLQPEAPEILLPLGELSAMRGAFDKGREYYQQAERIGQNNPSIAYHLACLESLAGNNTAALNWLEKALQRGWKEYDELLADKNLAQLRKLKEFEMLMMQYFPVWKGK